MNEFLTDSNRSVKLATAKKTMRALPISKELNYSAISENIWAIQSECGDIAWISEENDVVNDILGEDWAFEFKLQFQDLSSSCDQLIERLSELESIWYLDGDMGSMAFDLLWDATGADDMALYDMDSHEYEDLYLWNREWETKQVQKKLSRLTKEKLFELVGDSLWIVRTYMAIKYRYSLLQGIFEVLQDHAGGILAEIKGIEDAWQKWIVESNNGKIKYTNAESELDRILRDLPDKIWVE